MGVLLGHCGFHFINGGLSGVDLFFALSGFLITGLLLSEIAENGSLNLRNFYGRRAVRLFPALLPVLVAGPVIAKVWLPTVTRTTERGAVTSLFYVTNWYDAAGHVPGLFGHTWSLAVEGQFYVVWAVIIVFMARRGPRAVAAAALLLSAASLFERALLSRHATDHTIIRVGQGSDTRADALLIGCTVAAFIASLDAPGRARCARYANVLVWPALLVIVGVFFNRETFSVWTVLVLFHLAMALAGTALVACVTLTPSHPVARVLSARPLTEIGLISYGIYLWHYLIVLPLVLKGHSPTSALVEGGVPSIAIAALSFYLLERPVQRRLSGRFAVARTSAAA